MKIMLTLLLGITFGLMGFNAKTKNSTTTSDTESGVKFEKITFDKALKLAKSSGKLIFIDVYTTWCGPCKQMTNTTFKSERVGAMFNDKFINLKLDAELDVDGTRVAKEYSVSAYPTLLFINGEGKLVRRVVGYQTEDKLISIGSAL